MPRKYVLFYVVFSSFVAHVDRFFSLNMFSVHVKLPLSILVLCICLRLYSCGLCDKLLYSCWNGFYYSFPFFSLNDYPSRILYVFHISLTKNVLPFLLYFLWVFCFCRSILRLHIKGSFFLHIFFIDFISALFR